MAYQGKKSIRLNINLSEGLYKALNEYAELNMIPMNQVVRQALGAYMGVYPDGTPDPIAIKKSSWLSILADMKAENSEGDD